MNWLRCFLMLSVCLAGSCGIGYNDAFGQIGQALVKFADGSETRCDVLACDGKNLIIRNRDDSSEKSLPLASVLSIMPLQKPAPIRELPGTHLQLSSGGFLAVDNVEVSSETLNAASKTFDSIDLRLESIRGFSLKPQLATNSMFENRSTAEDVVHVQTSSGIRRVAGLLEEINPTHVQLSYQGKSRKISRDKVVAIVTAELGLPPLNGNLATIELTDSSKVTGQIEKLGQQMVVKTSGGGRLKFAASRVVSIQIDSDSLAYLSELEPVEVKMEPMFAPARRWRKNLSILGNPLTLNDSEMKKRTFSKGIGTMSYSLLAFDNSKKFTRFQGFAGIDTETGGRGDCQMTVRGDGAVLWTARVTAASPMIPIDVSIEGVQRLELTVQPGNEFDLADHANWCDAKMLKVD